MKRHRYNAVCILIASILLMACQSIVPAKHGEHLQDGTTSLILKFPLPTSAADGIRRLGILKSVLDEYWSISVIDQIESVRAESYRVRDETLRTTIPSAELIEAAGTVAHEVRQFPRVSFEQMEVGSFVVIASDGARFWGIRANHFAELGEDSPMRKAVERLASVIERDLHDERDKVIDEGRVVEGDRVPPMDVAISALAESPRRWDGKRVKVRGVFWGYDGDGEMYPPGSERSTMIHRQGPQIEIDAPGWSELRGGDPVEVTVVGVFLAQMFAPDKGTISRVTEVHIVNDK